MQAQVIILQYVCPILGIIIAQIMFSAPLQSVRECVKKGSLGTLNPAPWAVMTGNCIGWVGYSYLTKNIFVLLGNFPGVLISLWLNMCAIKLHYHGHTASIMRKTMTSYLINTRESIRSNNSAIAQRGGTSLQFEDVEAVVADTAIPATTETTNTDNNTPMMIIPSFLDSRIADLNALVQSLTAAENIKAPAPQEKILMIMASFWLFIFSIVSFMPIGNNKKILIVGILANVNTFFFYAAPLTTMVTVLRTKSSVSIHRRTMILNTVNGTFWSAYGLAVSDVFISIPNCVGTILGVVQIVLCILFPLKATLGDELLNKSIITSSYGTEEDRDRICSSKHDLDILNSSQINNGVITTHDYKSNEQVSMRKNDLTLHDETSVSTRKSSILRNHKKSNNDVSETREVNSSIESESLEHSISSVEPGKQDEENIQRESVSSSDNNTTKHVLRSENSVVV